MSSISAISLSGMRAAQVALDASANNVANADTPAYRRQQAVNTAQKDGGVSAVVARVDSAGSSPESDVVAQLQAKNAFLANLAVFKTSDQMAGALLKAKV